MTEPSETWQPRSMPALLINRIAHVLTRIADPRFRELGLGIGQMPVLVALKDGAHLPQKELARRAGVEQPTMAQLLARMERDGLIRRETDPADKRSSLISLTDGALQQLQPARAILSEGNQKALAGFGEEEIAQLVALLQRVLANVSDASGWSPAPEKAEATGAG